MADARGVERALERALGELIGRMELSVWQSLTSASPVDTGFFRSRWTPSVGSSLQGIEERPPLRQDAKREAAQRLSENEGKARSIARGYRTNQGRAFLTNPTKYGPFLAAGSSSQAAEGWIERAIVAGIRDVGNRPPRA